MADLFRATVQTNGTNPGDAATLAVDGSATPVTGNGLAGYTPAAGDRVLCSLVNNQLEIVQFLTRTVPTDAATYAGVVQAGSYSLGASPSVLITLPAGPTNVTAVALPTYFPVAGDAVLVAYVAGGYELLLVPTVSQVATTPGGPDRVEVGEGGADVINFYQAGTLVGSIQGYNNGTENVLQIVGDPINPDQAVLQLGTDYGEFFDKSLSQYFKFDNLGSYVGGARVVLNTPLYGEVRLDSTNGIWIHNSNAWFNMDPSGNIVLSSLVGGDPAIRMFASGSVGTKITGNASGASSILLGDRTRCDWGFLLHTNQAAFEQDTANINGFISMGIQSTSATGTNVGINNTNGIMFQNTSGLQHKVQVRRLQDWLGAPEDAPTAHREIPQAHDGPLTPHGRTPIREMISIIYQDHHHTEMLAQARACTNIVLSTNAPSRPCEDLHHRWEYDEPRDWIGWSADQFAEGGWEELITRDADGAPHVLHYEKVLPVVVDEFNAAIEAQDVQIAELRSALEALTAKFATIPK